MATVRVPLSSRKYPGLFALVDEEDAPRVLAHKWHPDLRGATQRYAYANVQLPDGRWTTRHLHRLILDTPGRIDHANGNGLDCRRSNLRPASHAQNMANQPKQIRNKGPFKGVYRTTKGARWRAAITVAGRFVHLGEFADAADAARAYDDAARKHFGPFACVNFPDKGERGAT